MITEDYVSFETAKLLKEKGFNEPCHCFYEYKKRLYNDMDKYFPNGMKNSDHDKEGNKGISAPTISLAMKWLREVHNIVIVVTSSMFWGKYNVSIYKKGNDYPFGFDGDSFIPSYEQACEIAIKYCLDKFNLNNYE